MDVTTTVTRYSGKDGRSIFGSIPMSYHVEHSLARGHWRTDMTVEPIPTKLSARAAAQAAQTRVARIEDDGDGSPPRLFNGAGARLTIPSNLASLLPPSKHPRPEAPPMSGKTRLPFDGRSAIRSIVLVPEELQRRSADLNQVFGLPIGRIGDLEDHVVDHGAGRRTEVVVDPAIGAITESTETKDGTVVLHATFTYERQPDGVASLRQVRIEHAADRSRGRVVTETTYRNLFIGKRS
jgi:hypothetical protein